MNSVDRIFVAELGRAGIKASVAMAVALALCAAGSDELTLEDFGFIDQDDLKDAIKDLTIDGIKLSALDKGRIYKVHRQASADVNRATPSSVTLPVPTVKTPTAPTAVKHKFADLLDQADDNLFEELPIDKLAELRNNYLQVTGGDPADSERPSSEQLSALKARLESGKSPIPRLRSLWNLRQTVFQAA